MIKGLRKKFIIVAMCSTFAVLATVMGVVNIANYSRVLDRADKITQFLAENGGSFREPPIGNAMEKKNDERHNSERPKLEGMSPETPFSTRFFTVTLDEDGNVMDTDLGKIAAIRKEDAEEYGKAVFDKNGEKGFQSVYRYRMVEKEDDIMIVFLDCRQDIENFRTFALTSVAVSVIGLLAVFILVVIFSKPVFRPVEESYRKQKQFITDASHEIKTPLTIIEANTEVLEMETGENQWTTSTRNQIKRLTFLTQQLITLSRLDEENHKSDNLEFSLSDAVIDSVQTFAAMIKMQGKKLDTEIEENIHFVGNEKSIRQLIGILMDNAVKYSTNEGSIRVSLKKKGKKIYLEVFNNTETIPKGNLEILFERFYRLDTSRNSETGGSGIGLSVAKAIVMSHKGKIMAYSEDGKSIKIIVEWKQNSITG